MKKIIFFCVIFVLFKEDSVLARRVREINPLRQIAAVVGETNAQTILGIVQRYSSSPQQIRDNLVNFYTFISQEFVPRGWWDERSLVFQRIMVEIFSHGLGKASYLLVEPDFEKKVGLLNYKSLLGLLNYYNKLLKAGFENLPEKFQGIIEEKDFELGKFYLLRKALDILPRNLEEWLERIKLPESQLGSWREVPLGIQRSIVELAAKELKKKIYMLLRDDFKKHFAFLDGKTLSGLVKSYSSILVFRRNLDLIPHTLNEWFDMIGQVYVTWAEVPRDIQWELIQKAASELGKEVLKVSSHDLIHHHFSFINNKTLSGIYEYYNSDIEALRRLLILPMLMKEVPLTNIIEPKNMLEWLAHFKENGISVEGWETVPMPVQRRFVQILAEHLNKSPAELTKNDFWVPIPLFGPEGTNGRALITLYYFYEDVRILLETLGFV